jgi:tRNA-intron endonuclease, archaea type
MVKKKTMKVVKKESSKKEIKFKGVYARERVISEEEEARNLYGQSRFGEIKESKIHYSLVEALYLMQKGILDVYDGRKKRLKQDEFIRKARKVEPNFWIRYVVYKDMRSRGYIIKTALKFGADFRVYDRGIKPGEDHAKWILYPIHESSTMTLYEFAAKNRVAHSTRKRLLLAIVDEEDSCTYYDISWTRP